MPEALLPAAAYGGKKRTLQDYALCQRYALIRRHLGECPYGSVARQDRDGIAGAFDMPEQLHEPTAHRFALVGQRLSLRVVRGRA